MRLELEHHIYDIKGGVAAQSDKFRLTAHGRYPEEARRNLERCLRSFFGPFERDGVLEEELALAGLVGEEDGKGYLTVVLVEHSGAEALPNVAPLAEPRLES